MSQWLIQYRLGIAVILHDAYLPHLQSTNHLDTLIETSNYILSTPIMPLITHSILLLFPMYIVSRREKGLIHLLLLHLQALQGMLPLNFSSNGSSMTTSESSKKSIANWSDFRWKVESHLMTMTSTLSNLSPSAS